MIKRAFQLVAASCLLAQVGYFHLLSRPADTAINAIAIVMVLTMLISGAFWFPFSEAVNALEWRWARPSGWRRVVFGLGIGLCAIWILPVNPAPLRESSVEVTALGTHGEMAESSEVWARLIVDGNAVPFDQLKTDGHWVQRDGLAVSIPPSQPSSFSWRGRADTAELRFVSHRWSGRVRVTQDGQSRELELFDPKRTGDLVVPLFQGSQAKLSLASPRHKGIQWYAMVLDASLMGCLVVVIFDLAAGRFRRSHRGVYTDRKNVWRDALRFAATPAFMSVSLLLLFAPGIMTSDSYDQWMQVSRHQYHDWHPPLHTFLEAAIRLVWNDPAMVALLQGAAMAVACGLLVAVVHRAAGTPRWAAYLGMVLLAFHPLVSVMTITLWKDVFYTVAVVFVAAGAVAIVCLGNQPIRRPSGFVGALLICIACLSFRHNGGPLLIAMTGFCMLLQPNQRWRIGLLFVLGFAANIVINGPVMGALGVTRVHIPFTIASHHIAAHLARNEAPASSEDGDLLRRIGEWNYNCASVDDTIFNKNYDAHLAAENSGRLVRIAVSMALASPLVELEHLSCVSSLVWRVSVRPGEAAYLARTGLYSDGTRVKWMYKLVDGVAEHSPLGQRGESIRSLLLAEQSDAWFDRPAIYLYAILFACAVVIGRNRLRWRVAACVVVAAVAQSASLLFFNVAQDARYQLPIYVMALCLVPILLTARRSSGVEIFGGGLPRHP